MLRLPLPAVGLEPTRCCQQQILSLPRLPFRHAGALSNKVYLITNADRTQACIPGFYIFSFFHKSALKIHANKPTRPI